MLEYIIKNEIEPMINIIAEEDILLIDTPPDEFMVWLYSDGDVSEEGAEAIEEYRREYIKPDDGWPSIFQ